MKQRYNLQICNANSISYNDTMITKEILHHFDLFLKKRDLQLQAIIVGGTALNLLGYINRQTRDIDIIAPELSNDIQKASKDFAKEHPHLWEEWLNNGHSSLTDILPTGWDNRLVDSFVGEALHLKTLSRSDLLKTKLFAYCDRGTDLADCIAMAPTEEELNEALQWVIDQDANELWPKHVEQTFVDLKQRLGHGT